MGISEGPAFAQSELVHLCLEVAWSPMHWGWMSLDAERRSCGLFAGGKWTTYRLMAEDAIDKALAGGRLSAAGPCRTKELPLMGAQGYTPALFTDVAQHYRVPHRPGAIDTRVARYLAGESGSVAVSLT